jgi:hypothetical protein
MPARSTSRGAFLACTLAAAAIVLGCGGERARPVTPPPPQLRILG